MNDGNRKHGHNSRKTGTTPTYRSWIAMKARCLNPARRDYYLYGGRGILIADRWLQFGNFLADMGERPSGTSLDRFPDKSGNYEKGNCRWATALEQANNTRSNILIRRGAEILTVAQLGEELHISQRAVRRRIERVGGINSVFDSRKSPVLIAGVCAVCATAFQTYWKHRRFCGQNCRARYNQRKGKPRSMMKFYEDKNT